MSEIVIRSRATGGDGDRPPFFTVTERIAQEELAVRMLGEGHSTQAIADRLGVSFRTASKRIRDALDRRHVAAVDEFRARENAKLDHDERRLNENIEALDRMIAMVAQGTAEADLTAILGERRKTLSALQTVHALRARLNGLEAATKVDVSVTLDEPSTTVKATLAQLRQRVAATEKGLKASEVPS